MARAGVQTLLWGAALSQVLLGRRVEGVRAFDHEEEVALASGANAANDSRRASLDWSSADNPFGRSMVTPAGFQGGKCNSCYIWAAVGSIESRAAINAGGSAEPQTLSVQQALDCVNKAHMESIGKDKQVYLQARGCQTGFPKPIMQYSIDEGFMTAAEYPVPYHPDDSFARDKEEKRCEVVTDKIAVKPIATVKEITGVKWVQKAIDALQTGPIAIAIDKSSYSIGTKQDVRKGGIAPKDCATHNQDHAVLLVGYGTEGDADYWLIKNSWGTAWGKDGFFRIPRGVNFCGAEQSGTYLNFGA